MIVWKHYLLHIIIFQIPNRNAVEDDEEMQNLNDNEGEDAAEATPDMQKSIKV